MPIVLSCMFIDNMPFPKSIDFAADRLGINPVKFRPLGMIDEDFVRPRSVPVSARFISVRIVKDMRTPYL